MSCSPFRFNKGFDGGTEGAGRLVVATPGLGLPELRRRGAQREFLRIEAGFDLAPFQRHRDRRTFTCARRQRGDRGRGAVVAQIVEEDAALALFLGHVEHVELGFPCLLYTSDAADERSSV